MREDNSIQEILSIAEKFIKHLESLERMIDYSEIIENEYKVKKDNTKSLGEIADLIIHVKSIQKINEEELEKKDEKYEADRLIHMVEELKSENDIIRYLYNNIDVSLVDGGISVESESSFVMKVIDSYIDESFNMDSDINQLLNSIIISLVTGMELLIADLFKDFIQNVDQSDFIKSKNLSYSDLVRIGTVEEARIFLIDEYTEELLKQSFKYWVDEIEKRIKLKIKSIPFLNNDLEKIFEVFQRRHLLIHNNGVINSLYLSKVHPDLVIGLQKDDQIDIDKNYIVQSIDIFRRFGIVLSYNYAEKKHRDYKDKLFSKFNSLLLTPSNQKCLGSRWIYKKVSNESTYDHESVLIAKINYFLSFVHRDDFDKVKSEVEAFNVATLSSEYKMAKYILLEKFDIALENFKVYCTTLSDNEIIQTIDWPLIKVARKAPEFNNFIIERLDLIIRSEEEDKIEV